MHLESLEQRQLLTASLVADFNTSPAGVEEAFQAPVRVQDDLFLTMHTKEYGNEIWKTDGTPDGTEILKDIAPGNADSSAHGLVELDDNLYFVASDGDFFALYRSDGTSEGTRPFHQLTSNSRNLELSRQLTSDPQSIELTVFAGKLYFVATSLIGDTQLWSSDGTTEGTQIAIEDLNVASELLVVGDSLVVPARTTSLSGFVVILDENGTTREQVFATDDNVFSQLQSVRSFGDQLFVRTSEGIWVSDLENEPRLIDQSYPGGSVEFNGELYSSKLENVVVTDGFVEFTVELWKTDLIADPVIATDRAGWPLGVLDDRLYFATFEDERTQVWSTDGTPESEELAFEADGLIDTLSTMVFQDSDAIYLSIIADRTSQTSDYDLWEITPDSTKLVGTSSQPSSTLGKIGERVLLLRDDGIHGLELWSYDTQDASLELLKDANPGSADDSFGGLVAAGDRLFFTDGTGRSLWPFWSFDGSQRTRMTHAGIPSGGGLMAFHPYGDRVTVDIASGLEGNRELWVWDGSLDSATKLFSFSDPPFSRSASTVKAAGDNHFLIVEESIWFTDGTTAGSRSLKEITPQISEEWKIRGDAPTPTLGNEIYFATTDPDDVSQLWRSDGTEAGTEIVHQLHPFDFSRSGDNSDFLTATNGFVYFLTGIGETRSLLRSADGDVTSIVVGSEDLPVPDGSVLGVSAGVFLTTRGQVWYVNDVSDVAAPMLADLPRGVGVAQSQAVGERLFFVLNDSLSDRKQELWTSDGTPEGTMKIRSLQFEDDEPLEVVQVGDNYYFAADDGVSGKELWGTDGTPEGTFSYDINPGINSSSPQSLTADGDALYFTATSTLHGRELWNVSGPPPTPGDLNRDGDVSFSDFLIFSRHINGSGNVSESDLNGDGAVDFADFLILSDNFGSRQEPPVSTTPLIPEVVDLVAADDPFDEDELVVPRQFPFSF